MSLPTHISWPLLLITLWLAVLGGGGWWLRGQTLECRVADQVCPPELQHQLSSVLDHSLFFYDYSGQITHLLNENGNYELQAIRKKIPGTLVVDLHSTTAQYQIVLPNTQVLIVNQLGKTRSSDVTDAQLPQVQLAPTFNWQPDSESVPGELHQWLLSVVSELERHHLTYQKVTLVSDHQIEVQLLPELTAILDDSQPTLQIKRMALIVPNYPFSVPVRTIDVRYELPVLK